MAFKATSPQGDSPLVSEERRKFLFGKLSGKQPEAQMGGQLGSNLFGALPSNSQMPMGGAMGSGEMPQFNMFGTDEFGNPKFQLPSSEPREYFGPFKKEVEDKRAGSFEELFGKDSRLDKRSQQMIFGAQSSGKMTREQAQGLAGRIQDYYDNKAQQGIFSDITSGGSLLGGYTTDADRQREKAKSGAQQIKPQAFGSSYSTPFGGFVGGSSGPTFSSSYV